MMDIPAFKCCTSSIPFAVYSKFLGKPSLKMAVQLSSLTWMHLFPHRHNTVTICAAISRIILLVISLLLCRELQQRPSLP